MDLTASILIGTTSPFGLSSPSVNINDLREYPVASERGGREADFENYVSFLAKLREALDGSDKTYGLTITLPSSYWYMQHFDIKNMDKSVDWVRLQEIPSSLRKKSNPCL